MSSSINMIILQGRVGKEPESRTFDSGAVFTGFSLATTERGFRKQDGTEVPERTEWHNIECWRKLAEIAAAYVHKGDLITVTGKQRSRNYERDGKTMTFSYVEAQDIVLAPKAAQQPAAQAQPTAQPQPQHPAQPQQQPMWPPQDGNDLPF